MVYKVLDSVQIGKTLKDLREKKNKTMDELSGDLGISQSAICMYEAGKRVPRDEIKIRIAEYYGVPVDSIFFPSEQHETC